MDYGYILETIIIVLIMILALITALYSKLWSEHQDLLIRHYYVEDTVEKIVKSKAGFGADSYEDRS